MERCIITLSLLLISVLSTVVGQEAPQEQSSTAQESTAQEETLLSGIRIKQNGGFGAVSIKFTPIAGQTGTLVGGYGGWLINKTFLVGGGGYGLANAVRTETSTTALPLSFGYGGAVFEYIANSDQLLHYGAALLVGGGDVGYGQLFDTASSTVFVLEPSVYAELNLTNYARMNFGASYRLVRGVQIPLLSNVDLSGASIVVQLKFGKF